MLRFKKADLLIPLTVCLAAILIYLIPIVSFGSVKGAEAAVTVDGELYGVYPLDKDIDILIPGANGGSNRLVIRNGEADIVEATCPDKICVHERKIRNRGETLVCLPNRVVVEIRGAGENGIDSVAR